MEQAAGKLVLVVEDDSDVAEATRIVLEGAGYRVQLAGNAAEGKAQAQAGRPDLILLDVMMPAGTEGFQLVWDLRQEEDAALRDTPIVIMTTLHRKTRLRLYPEQGDDVYRPYEFLPVQGFLDKPVSPGVLLTTVARALAEAARPWEGGREPRDGADQ